MDRGDNATAEVFLMLSLSLQRNLLGPMHIELVEGIDLLATMLFNERRWEEAQLLWQKADKIITRSGGTHPRHQQILQDLRDVQKLLP